MKSKSKHKLNRFKEETNYFAVKAVQEPELILPFIRKTIGENVRKIIFRNPLVDIPSYHISKNRLELEDLEHTTNNELYRFLKSFNGIGNYKAEIMQSEEDITELLNKLQEEDIQKVMEIGTAYGGTLFMWSNALKDVEEITSIDIDFGPRRKFFRKFNEEISYNFIEGKSQDPYIQEKAKKIVGDEKIDFLYIDGDHSYEGVKQDFEFYKELVKDDGIIAFHDVDYADSGVPRFWSEIKEEYKTVELGISAKNGIVYLGQDAN